MPSFKTPCIVRYFMHASYSDVTGTKILQPRERNILRWYLDFYTLFINYRIRLCMKWRIMQIDEALRIGPSEICIISYFFVFTKLVRNLWQTRQSVYWYRQIFCKFEQLLLVMKNWSQSEITITITITFVCCFRSPVGSTDSVKKRK